jgi:hypothetical protein
MDEKKATTATLQAANVDTSGFKPVNALQLQMSPNCGISRKTGKPWYQMEYLVSRGGPRRIRHSVMLTDADVIALEAFGVVFPELIEKDAPERNVYGGTV